MKRFMLRADDLGYSEAVNYGIEKTVKEGVIQNIGFMVNMQSSEHGYELIKNEAICLGQHTNICVGKPILDPKCIPSLVQENGEFKSSKEYREAFARKEDFVVLDEVILEIEAQYDRFVAITGRKPQYFEGHAIESNNFMKGLEIVANKYSMKFINVSFDGTPIEVNGQKMYMWMDSMLSNYDPEQSFLKMIQNSHEDGFDMLILHPGYLDDYIITHSSLTIARTKEVSFASSRSLKEYLKKHQIRLYTYDEV